MNDNIQRAEESRTQPHKRAHAEAKITVHNSEAKPFDQTAKPALMKINLTETFSGDIDGESSVRALQVSRDDHSAKLVSMQRFRGKLGGREGTFVLQGHRNSRERHDQGVVVCGARIRDR